MERPVRSRLDRSQDLDFQALAWHAEDVSQGDDAGNSSDQYTVKIFGCTAEGKSVSVSVQGFRPFFYLKLPNRFQPPLGKWNKENTGQLDKALREIRFADIYAVQQVRCKDLWGFSNDTKFNFIKISFFTLKGMRKVQRELTSTFKFGMFGQYIFKTKEIYESNIDPYIRMMHELSLEPTGWISLPAGSFRENAEILETNCEIDVVVSNYATITPAECEETAPFLVASFDLECTSNTGDFPVPLKDYKRLATDLYELYEKHKNTMLDYHLKDVILKALMYAFNSDTEFEYADMIHKVQPKNLVNLKELTNHWSAFADDAYAILTGKIMLENENDKINREKIVQVLTKEFGSYAKEKEKNQWNPNHNKIATWVSKHGFPQLQGDPVIQIGTTYHRFGDRECCHKQIFTLGTCEPVEGAVVVECKTERELLERWQDHIIRTDPDIMTGYNIFGFDFTYIHQRAKELGIIRNFMKLSRFKDHMSDFKETRLSSSALGDNFLKYIDMEGRVLIDLMKVIQRDHKLDSYKLDNVAHHFMGMNKNDVTPQEIFALQLGSAADRQRIAAYCVQDCALCNHLMIKLEIIANNMGMSNVCCVPLSFIFMRGQGIKIFSLVLKQCREDGYLIPVIKPPGVFGAPLLETDDDSYEGAIVLEPKKGIYLDAPISVLDYASLYPSSMISENLSPDSIVLDDKYDNLPGVEYLDIEWTEGKTARFVQPANGEKGVLPRILMKLLKARKATRKRACWQSVFVSDGSEHRGFYDSATGKMTLMCGTEIQLDASDVTQVKDTYNEFQKAVLDGLQNAYKVTANSLYGQMGARTSPIYLKEIAASTTATGRKMIMMAKQYIEENYEGAEVVYGDSVTGDSPILLRFPDGHVEIKTIDSLTEMWAPHDKFKVWDDMRYEKEQGLIDAETWTTNGWAKIRRVIRHKTNKKIYRVSTQEGSVDVTEDHSLLDENRNAIKPTDCVVGETKLFHSFPSEFPHSVESGITKNQAWLYGLFFRDGRCDRNWTITNSNRDYLEKAASYMRTVEPSEFKITSGLTLEPVSLIPGMLERYSALFYDKNGNKQVPTVILNAHSDIRLWFIRGFLTGESPCIGKSGAQGIYYLMRSIGYNVSVHVDDTGFWTVKENNTPSDCTIKIKKELGTVSESGSFVYDLETEDGTFLSGVGSINKKNTDSLFIRYKTADEMGNVLTGTEAIRKSREYGIDTSSKFKKLIKPPHDLEFEKIFSPFILLSKKRYVGNKFEMDDHKFKQASMGIVLKRRDNANIVKKIYGGVIDIILNAKDITKAVQFLHQQLDDLVNGKCPMDDLILSKSLRAEYKDPTRIAHKVLAERIGERDPGNKPQTNDRIQFVYVEQEPGGKKLLQGERIETPLFIRENNLKPDYNHYITNQIMKPILQLFAIVVEQLPNYNKPAGHFDLVYQKILDDLKDEEKAKDKLDSLKESHVKELLFDPVLNRNLEKPKKPRKSKYDPAVLLAPPPPLIANPSTSPQEALPPKPKRVRKPKEIDPNKPSRAKKIATQILREAEEPPLLPPPRPRSKKIIK